MLDESRLLKPMIKKTVRKRGEYKEVAWNEALDYAAARLKAIIETHGPEAVALFGSPRMTNEELYLLQKLARVGLKTNNIGSFTNLLNGVEQDALDEMFGITTSTATTDDLASADLILVVNADVSEESLVAELKIKAAQKNGARLVTVSASEIELNKFADVWIDAKRGTGTALIQGMSKAVIDKGLADTAFIKSRAEGYETFKESVADLDLGGVSELTGVGKEKLTKLYDLVAHPDWNIIVVYNVDSLWEKSRNDLKAIGNFMMLTGRVGKPGNGIILLRDYSNSQGLFDMGADAPYSPPLI
jgi:predicted molibdopterin-dependent oxidoreductase YjgC